jgi:predicted component of type VI protein secretion system
MLQAKLIVVGGEVKTQEVKLRLPTVIGRGKEANLKVPLALVSRAHCEIRERDGRLFIRDLGSLNGTFVNNYKITTEQPLLPGELVTVGTVTFRAEYEMRPKQAAAVVSAPLKNKSNANRPAVHRASEEQIVFSPVAAEKPSDRTPSKKTPAAATLDATVAGTMSVTVSPGSPVKLSEPASLKPVKAQASPSPAAKATKQTPPARAKTEPAKREEVPAPVPSASHSNPIVANRDNVLDDFPLESSAQKSISVSAIEELRFNSPRQVSFIGDLNFGEAVLEPTSEPVRIELGEKEAAGLSNGDADDAQLDSFFRRIAQPSE